MDNPIRAFVRAVILTARSESVCLIKTATPMVFTKCGILTALCASG